MIVRVGGGRSAIVLKMEDRIDEQLKLSIAKSLLSSKELYVALLSYDVYQWNARKSLKLFNIVYSCGIRPYVSEADQI